MHAGPHVWSKSIEAQSGHPSKQRLEGCQRQGSGLNGACGEKQGSRAQQPGNVAC